jgi:hypothetical protein
VTGLDRQLRELADALEVPPPPAEPPGVANRLPARPVRRIRSPRRALAVVFACVLLAASAAAAVQPARDAILRILGLRGATIERVLHLPPRPPRALAPLKLGSRIAVWRARHAARFTALLPPAATAAYLARDIRGGRISVEVGHLLLIEFRASSTPFVVKRIGPDTKVQRVRVNGGPGVYLSGGPHEVFFRDSRGAFYADSMRLPGEVLLWQQGPLTMRIEGATSLSQALELARSLR